MRQVHTPDRKAFAIACLLASYDLCIGEAAARHIGAHQSRPASRVRAPDAGRRTVQTTPCQQRIAVMYRIAPPGHDRR